MKRIGYSIMLVVSAAFSPALSLAHPTGPDVKISEVGTTKIGEYEVSAKQVGPLEKTATFEIYVKGAAEPKAVRAWIGEESGKGSVKAKAIKTPKYYDADVEVPGGAGNASLWIEIDGQSGREKGALPLPAKE